MSLNLGMSAFGFFVSEAHEALYYFINGDIFFIPVKDMPLIDASLRARFFTSCRLVKKRGHLGNNDCVFGKGAIHQVLLF